VLWTFRSSGHAHPDLLEGYEIIDEEIGEKVFLLEVTRPEQNATEADK
jgi:hypothetical protein